jgi:hypothetical protein
MFEKVGLIFFMTTFFLSTTFKIMIPEKTIMYRALFLRERRLFHKSRSGESGGTLFTYRCRRTKEEITQDITIYLRSGLFSMPPRGAGINLRDAR